MKIRQSSRLERKRHGEVKRERDRKKQDRKGKGAEIEGGHKTSKKKKKIKVMKKGQMREEEKISQEELRVVSVWRDGG